MSPRKRVRRLDDIALVRVAEFVGRCIVEPARRCDLDELYRNVAFIRSDVGVCIPAAMYDEYAVIVLKTISRAIDSAEISEAFLHEFMASPIMTIIDELSTIKNYPEVSLQLLLLVYMNLRKLKKIKELVVDMIVVVDLRDVLLRFYPNSSIDEGPIHLLKECDLQFMETFVCPESMFDAYTLSLLKNCSRLQSLEFNCYIKLYGRATMVSNDLSGISGLRELVIHDFEDEFDSVLPYLLSRNQRLEKLSVWHNLEVFLGSVKMFHALKHLEIYGNHIDTAVLRTVAPRFPNLTNLALYLEKGFDTSILMAFPHLSSLTLQRTDSPLENLWVLLCEIGHNIVELSLGEPMSRRDLLRIYQHCRSCEKLELVYRSLDDDPLILPPFPRLKHLDIDLQDSPPPLNNLLDFTEMPFLEYLCYHSFEIPRTRIESMMLDSQNFPRLTKIQLDYRRAEDEVKEIRRFIKQHNLDVTCFLQYQYV